MDSTQQHEEDAHGDADRAGGGGPIADGRPGDGPPGDGRLGEARLGYWPLGPGRLSRGPSGAAIGAFLAVCAVTAALAVTALVLYKHNERRLLNLRAREIALVLGAQAPVIQTPLASGAALADATGGSLPRFEALMSPYVGAKREFGSASLWELGAKPRPLAVLGSAPPQLSGLGPLIARLARRPGLLNLTGLLPGPPLSLGYVYRSTPTSHWAIYAQSALPSNRRSKLESNTAFSDLNYAFYYGRSQKTSHLLVTSLKKLPATGLKSVHQVPFGTSEFTEVVTPSGSLSGSFFGSLPWITALVGFLVALAAGAMADRLVRGRRRAEQLARQLDQIAAETRDRYIEQRSIAQTLQHELLPQQLPELDGLRVKARYVPAQAGGDIGGDWYDIVPVGEGRGLLVIGDVSGHGVEAATTMALVRHALLAYVAEDHRPGVVLAKLSEFVRGRTSDYFATVLCGLIDVEDHRVTFASAGHLAPLLLDGEEGSFVQLHPEAPIGFPHNAPLRETTVSVPAAATLVAFTDGLVERRGEILDEGLERMRTVATSANLRDEQLLARLADELTTDDHRDDTALVSVRWQN